MTVAKILVAASTHNPMSSVIPATEKEAGISMNGLVTPSIRASLTKFFRVENLDLSDLRYTLAGWEAAYRLHWMLEVHEFRVKILKNRVVKREMRI